MRGFKLIYGICKVEVEFKKYFGNWNYENFCLIEWRRWRMNYRWFRGFYNECLVDDGIEELGNIGEGVSFIVEGISLVLDILILSIYELFRWRCLVIWFGI